MSNEAKKPNRGCFSKADPARASAAGKKGGSISGGKFVAGDSRASEAGRKGGKACKGRPATKGSFVPGAHAAAVARMGRKTKQTTRQMEGA